MKIIGNMSIRAKALVASSLSAVAVIAMVALFMWSVDELRQADEIKNEAVTLMSQARDARGEFTRGNATLYRAINLKSQNVEASIVRSVKVEAMQAIEQAKTIMGSLQSDLVPLDREMMEGPRAALGIYAQAAKQAADFVEEDA